MIYTKFRLPSPTSLMLSAARASSALRLSARPKSAVIFGTARMYSTMPLASRGAYLVGVGTGTTPWEHFSTRLDAATAPAAALARRKSATVITPSSLFGAASMTPTSVMMPLISAQGVTSKAGFQAAIPSGAIRWLKMVVSSAAGRSSISISAPLAIVTSSVVVGAAVKKGTPWYLAAMASW